MVGYNEINTERFGKFDLDVGGYTRINGYNKLCPALCKHLNRGLGYSVSFTDTVGDIVINACAVRLKIKIERTYGRYSVNVIISVDSYLFIFYN